MPSTVCGSIFQRRQSMKLDAWTWPWMVWGPFSMFHQGLSMNSLLVRLFIIVVNYAVGTSFTVVLIFLVYYSWCCWTLITCLNNYQSEIGLFRVEQSKRVKTSLWKSWMCFQNCKSSLTVVVVMTEGKESWNQLFLELFLWYSKNWFVNQIVAF